MSAQTAPAFHTHIMRDPAGSGRWLLKYSIYIVGYGIKEYETLFDDRAAAAKESIRLSFEPKETAAPIRLTPAAETRANDYLADNPLLQQELNALFSNWQNSI